MASYMLRRLSQKVLRGLTATFVRPNYLRTSATNRTSLPTSNNVPQTPIQISFRSFSKDQDRPEFGQKFPLSWLAFAIPPFLVLSMSFYHLLYKPEHGMGMLKRPWRYQKGVFTDVCCKDDNDCNKQEETCPVKDLCCKKKEDACKKNEDPCCADDNKREDCSVSDKEECNNQNRN